MLVIEQGQIGEKTLPFHSLPPPTLRILIKNNLLLFRNVLHSGEIFEQPQQLRTLLEYICPVFSIPVVNSEDFEIFQECAAIYQKILLDPGNSGLEGIQENEDDNGEQEFKTRLSIEVGNISKFGAEYLSSLLRHLSLFFMSDSSKWEFCLRKSCSNIILQILKVFRSRSPHKYRLVKESYFEHLFQILAIEEDKQIIQDIFQIFWDSCQENGSNFEKYWPRIKKIGNKSSKHQL